VEENKGVLLVLHPALAALTIVITNHGELSQISRSHPGLDEHMYFRVVPSFLRTF
jgi:hypothetical protein